MKNIKRIKDINKVKYIKPKLNFFGKLSKLTLGFSQPIGESGMTNLNMESQN